MSDEHHSLPGSWNWAAFADVAAVESDLVDPSGHPEKPHIAPNHIESGTGRLLPYRTVAEDGVTSPKHRFHAGQILYSKIRPYLAKAVLANFEGLCSADMYPVRGYIEAVFLHQWLISSMFTAQVSRSQGRTVLPKINQKALATKLVPVAPLNEQKRIVAKIESLQIRSEAAKEALDAIPPLLEKFRQSVLAAAFRGDLTKAWRAQNPDVEPASELLKRIRTERRTRWIEDAAEKARAKAEAKARSARKPWSDDDDSAVLEKERAKAAKKYREPEPVDREGLPELPDGWCWASVEETSDFVTDGEHATPKRTGSGVFLLSARNVRNGHLSLAKVDYISQETHRLLSKRLRVQKGDVLLSCSGTVGRSCTVDEGLRFSLVRSVAVVRPVLVDDHFESLAFRAPVLQSQMDRAKTQTAQSNLFQGKIKRLAMPLAPIAEQRVLVTKLNDMLEFIEIAEERSASLNRDLENLQQATLAKAFRGELVPQDPNDEPASVLLERIRAEREAQAPKKNARRKRNSKAEPRAEPFADQPKKGKATARRKPKTSKAPEQAPEELTQAAAMALIRKIATRAGHERDDLLRDLANALGYLRLGKNIKKALSGHVRAAVRRGILESEDGVYFLSAARLSDMEPEVLRKAIGSAMSKGRLYEREEVFRLVVEHLGFARLSQPSQKALKSALNSAIRRGEVERFDARRVRNGRQ
ncbi:MAG: restriction endonuclease subunit S [Deltaproteobacteria bacterium]|nr:restriction endonuclease subunit S [Deltaproteobacteria bacterium]